MVILSSPGPWNRAARWKAPVALPVPGLRKRAPKRARNRSQWRDRSGFSPDCPAAKRVVSCSRTGRPAPPRTVSSYGFPPSWSRPHSRESGTLPSGIARSLERKRLDSAPPRPYSPACCWPARVGNMSFFISSSAWKAQTRGKGGFCLFFHPAHAGFLTRS